MIRVEIVQWHASRYGDHHDASHAWCKTSRASSRHDRTGVMVKPEWFSSAQMQALNPALVMILIP
jgi:hypothetical protein